VLLVDVVSETAPVPQAASVPVVVAAATVARDSPSQPAAVSQPSKAAEGATKREKKSTPSKSQDPVKARAKPEKARLKLAPLDLSEVRDPTLSMSNEIVYTPGEDPTQRAQAQALWRAINTSPEDVLRDSARLIALEGEFKNIQGQTAKNRQLMEELTVRLDSAEQQRYANPLVYALALLLIACVGTMVVGWRRLKAAESGESPWWKESQLGEQEVPAPRKSLRELVAKRVKEPPVVSRPMKHTTQIPVAVPAKSLAEVDIDLQLAESAFADLGKPNPRSNPQTKAVEEDAQESSFGSDAKPSFVHSVNSIMREINTQEMLDVRQQADFFLALGQYDEAIAVLKSNINANAESNPLVYLDLIKVYHTLSQKTGFYQYRDEFNQLFTGHVPEYATFNDQGNFLDSYPDVCEHIVSLWPSTEALKYIEQCLVRTPEMDPSQGFDLEAYRELLLLHGVAKRIVSDSESELMPFSTLKFPSVPAPLAPSPVMAAAKPVMSTLAPAGVDLDLSEPADNLIEFDPPVASKPDAGA
jgi:tetratricopeptide (TPR) repeat protein